MPRKRLFVIIAVVAILLLAATLGYVVLRASLPPGSGAPSGLATCPLSPGNGTAANWTSFHRDSSRSGLVAAPAVHTVVPAWNAATSLDGKVHAEPLVCGATVYVATEANTVYAINASSGSVDWRTNLGTPVAGSALPCGNIDPSGITGTPVLDTATGLLYVVAFLSSFQHELFALDALNGSVRSHFVVDPPGADPKVEQQRGALLLHAGTVYVPYGGLYGDCGNYHGWVVGVRTDGTGGLLSYQVPTHREGGIWAPGGFALAANGSLYVATGNGDSTTSFDEGESVIELSPTLAPQDLFAPGNWAQLNQDDTDIGSVAPTLLPGGEVFQVGKAGVGYVLSATRLGGVGGQLGEGPVCGGGAYGGTARVGQTVLVACTDGLVDILVGPTNFTVAWRTTSFNAGPPVVTGQVVWAMDTSSGDLLGFNLTTGQQLFSQLIGPTVDFNSLAATSQMLFVTGGGGLHALRLG